MNRNYRALLAALVALCVALGPMTPGVKAADSPSEESAALEQTIPAETTATEETQPVQETEPEQTQASTEPAEPQSVPEETQPAEEPQEVIPAHSIQVPLFYQTDYPYERFATGTIATSGCSITCLAMVATYMADYPYLPDELADYFGGYMPGVRNKIERMEAASDVLQLPWRRATNFHDAMDALKEGCVVIAMMNQNSLFTSSQHFIVWAGMTEDGKVLVNDPYEPNYSKWNLEKAFLYGFEEGDLISGFSGAWIYDKAEMPEEPFIYMEEKEVVECRYPEVHLDENDRELMARMVWVEARGESAEGQQAVAEVVLNRLVSDTYSDTVRDIIYSSNQFRSTRWLDEAEPTQAQYDAVDDALNGPYVLPMDVVHFATYPVTDQVWGTIGGHVFCYRWAAEE